MNTRTRKAKTYHLIVSFRPKDEARLTPELLRTIEARFAAVLDLSEHQRHCGIHKNTGNLHLHVAYNLIHPEPLTIREPFRDFRKRDHLCRELESGQHSGGFGKQWHRQSSDQPFGKGNAPSACNTGGIL